MNWSISHRSYSNQRGFTLIEVLVAISILAVVLTSVYGIFSSVSTAREHLNKDSEGYHKARVLFDRLGRELRGVYYDKRNSKLVFQSDAPGEEGSLFFNLTTTSVTPLSRTGSGLARVSYRLVKDPESLDGSLVLLRSENPAHEPDVEGGGMMRLVPGIKTLSLNFYRDGKWHSSWEGRTSGLPEMVGVELRLFTEDERVVSFNSAFDVPRVDPR